MAANVFRKELTETKFKKCLSLQELHNVSLFVDCNPHF